ncbi:hypothetical protein COCC4DRAFT_35201 [Bipolaris maydis ATCC 48331]|uniref:Uncharacterized protein n=2 Tax=Cochliobolus heterostrophus TaxID=5016 RepID=M2UFC6_COCH5|nr:uncharacterized protein COCC4DRAFT_35201 [Bipolaris maydis ATCC 48331]EMD86617.1 hypothetical protein COCHEDRAFT_1023838 [Bipolaris maydis C5]ENH98543.1 hypothetical protein COCC4DRAFT_35201 [Bipolaris maydis ATCC 48331]
MLSAGLAKEWRYTSCDFKDSCGSDLGRPNGKIISLQGDSRYTVGDISHLLQLEWGRCYK